LSNADGIHPNDTGHSRIAKAFIDKIRTIPGLLSSGSSGGTTPTNPNVLLDTFTAVNGATIIGKAPVIGGNPWYKWVSTSSDGAIINNRATGVSVDSISVT
jgi:hypothetical protein